MWDLIVSIFTFLFWAVIVFVVIGIVVNILLFVTKPQREAKERRREEFKKTEENKIYREKKKVEEAEEDRRQKENKYKANKYKLQQEEELLKRMNKLIYIKSKNQQLRDDIKLLKRSVLELNNLDDGDFLDQKNQLEGFIEQAIQQGRA